jgi:hypothetical protein
MLMDWAEEFPGGQGLLTLSSTSDAMPAWGVFFYSAFFASVWLWLFAAAGMAIKGMSALGLNLLRVRRVLDIDEKPLRSIGFVGNLLVSIVYVGMALR